MHKCYAKFGALVKCVDCIDITQFAGDTNRHASSVWWGLLNLHISGEVIRTVEEYDKYNIGLHVIQKIIDIIIDLPKSFDSNVGRHLSYAVKRQNKNASNRNTFRCSHRMLHVLLLQRCSKSMNMFLLHFLLYPFMTSGQSVIPIHHSPITMHPSDVNSY